MSQEEKLTESFKWLMPFKHMFDGVKHIISGNAITVGETKNRVPYTHDELLRSARTLTNQPLLINHLEKISDVQDYLQGRKSDGESVETFDPRLIPLPVQTALSAMVGRSAVDVGHVVLSEFEDNAVQYVAHVTDPATQAALPLVKGVSIGAVPRLIADKRPLGIIFTDLSLIFDPEIPADPDATAKVMEKLREMLRPPSYRLADVNAELVRRVDARIQVVRPSGA